MEPELWHRVEDLYHQARELDESRRAEFLERCCGDDEALRREVESLLAHQKTAEHFIESPALEIAGKLVANGVAPGTRLGNYEVQRLLGSGGMGEVYRARDTQLGREVAIKVLPAFLSHDRERLRRFEQEARAAAALNHPNILAVFQLGTYGSVPYLVSELLEGSTLRDLLRRSLLPVRKAIDYGVQIARGLAAAHEKGITHRDLKPENLFITKDGRVKILDFGLAKLTLQETVSDQSLPTVSEQTEPGVVMGTVGYMSPEQVRGKTADHRTDIFAFGAILYEMLTGKRAFQKLTPAETMTAILNEEPPAISQIVPSVPPALNRVVQRCLEKRPEQRFHSASDLAFALEALSDTASFPRDAFAVLPPRSGWLWIACSGAAVIIAVVFAIWLARSPSVPVVESVVQLTNDGQSKGGNVETDGARVYFNEGPSGSLRIAQVSVNGGQTGDVATTLTNPQIAGLTADGSSLLVLIGAPTPTRQTMWSLPLPVGQARRLGSIDVTDASLFPDGRLLYAVDTALFSAEKDGADARQLDIRLSIRDSAPRVSPDGQRLVFSDTAVNHHTWVINEGASDGTGVHPVLKSAQGLPDDVCCLRWTSDGSFILFGGESGGRWDIWALSDQKRLISSSPQTVRLTNGPVSYSDFTSSRDGKRIFAIGAQRRGELVRYDTKTREYVPFMGGISAFHPEFSRDGKWLVYTSYPEYALWRSRIDGSDRLQLTYPPLIVAMPRISPDGERVAFNDSQGNAYVMSANGGVPRRLTDHFWAPCWSPDGNLLAASARVPGDNSAEKDYFKWRIVDVRSGSTSDVPEAKHWVGPWFVTQDTLIAVSEDQSKFALFDFSTRKWTDLMASSDKFVDWEVSPDAQYFLYSTGGNNPRIFRMRLRDHHVEEVASLKNLRVVDDPYSGPQLSVSPDHWPLLTRDIGTQEVYAISVKWQ